jgi:hypothetical protein
MQWQQLVIDIYERVSQELEHALDGLTVEDLNQRPCPDCNSIGWLAWHLTRAQDSVTAYLSEGEQVWISEKWYTRFNRTPDPKDIGARHSLEDVAAFISPNASTLLEYHHAVLERSERYITNKLSESELERVFDNPPRPDVTNVRTRIMRIINDNMQHLGQINYIRGMLKGWGWLGR